MKTQEEYNAMELEDLWRAMQCGNKYELRKIHKALRRFGDSVPFMYRYPDFPIYFSLVSMVLCAVAALVAWVVRVFS